jgi:hypothetical protein
MKHLLRNVSARGAGLLWLACLLALTAQAQPSHYFPGSNINYTGGSNIYPLNSTSRNKCQWLYKSTDFNSVPSGNFLITKIYFKPSTTRTNQSITNLTIKLKNTTLTTLSTGAWVSGMTTVYTLTGTISTTANSWKAITLSSPFVYTGGNLIFEMSHSLTTTGINVNQYSVSVRYGRKYGSASSSSAAGRDRAVALFGFDGVPAACSGTPSTPTITTAAMSTASPLCAGGTKSLTAFDPNAPVTGLSYSWQQASGSSGPWTNVTAGSGATTTHYTTGVLAASTWFRFGVKCIHSNITKYSSPYLVRIGAAQPGSITGRAAACPGDHATYSVPAVAGHTYNWALPSGWTGSSTTNSINVTMGGPGTISVTATGCGGSSVARSRGVVAGSAPIKPGTIAGLTYVCAGTSETYKIAAVSTAQSYIWTLPNGWTGSSAADSINVLTGASSGNVKVTAVNGCGTSPIETKAVTVISSLANPGVITSSAGSGPYCAGELYSFSINPVPGATSYIWTLPSGWSGTNTGTSIQAFAGSSGTVYARAYVTCATSPAATVSATVNASVNPAVSVAPTATPLCKSQPVTFAATPSNGGTSPVYRWRKNGSLVIASANSYTTTSLATGDVISVEMVSNAACRSTDTAISGGYAVTMTPSVTPGISINSNPVVEICAGTPLNLTTKITGRGDHPQYQWYHNGVAVAGADDTAFTPAMVADGDSFSVVLESDAVCATDTMAYSNVVHVQVEPIVTPGVAISASTLNAREPVVFTLTQTGGGPTPDFQWILNNVDIPGETGSSYSSPGLSPGDRVSVRMQSYERCASPSVVVADEIVMADPAAVASAQGWQGTLGIFPNPNNGRFTLAASWPEQNAGKPVSVEVFNMLGQRVDARELHPSQTKWKYELQLSEGLPSGHYTVRISTKDGMEAHVPIVLQR